MYIEKSNKHCFYNALFFFLFAESEKYHEIIAATESPPKAGTFRLDDDAEFPPVTQRTDWISEKTMKR